jgi:hypothetical protein
MKLRLVKYSSIFPFVHPTLLLDLQLITNPDLPLLIDVLSQLDYAGI